MKTCDNNSKPATIVLIPSTPFEKGMSISTWQEKRNQNTQKIIDNMKENIENGTAIHIRGENEIMCASTGKIHVDTGCFQYRKVLRYHPSNSKKGFPIKGTNLRVSFEYI